MGKYIFVLLLFVSCAPKITDTSNQSEKEIIKADKDMSNLAAKVGFNKALLQYADENVVKPTDGHFSIIGLKAFRESVGDKAGTKTLSWVPYKAEAARSGDLGYTLGHWTLIAKDTTLYGDYITFWKKQKDGNWKFVLDAGNGTPKPQ